MFNARFFDSTVMKFSNQGYTLMGFVGATPMTDFDGREMAQESTHERTLKRGLHRFAPDPGMARMLNPSDMWNAAAEAVNVITHKVGLDRLMVMQHSRRLLNKRAIENVLTKELFPERGQDQSMAPVMREIEELKSRRGMTIGKPKR